MIQWLIGINSSSTSRILAARSFLHRHICTAAAVESETAVASAKDDSSATESAGKPASSKGMRRLYRRLSAIGVTGKSVANVLDEYTREGRLAGKNELLNCVRELRKFKRYKHCFEIFEWMDKAKHNYSHQDYALRLDIICKTKGIAEAEKFFESLSSEEKNLYTYGALLNCYCTEKLTDKAAALVEEMDKLNYITSLTLTNLMTLALTTGEPEKVPSLAEEMKKRNLPLTTYAYTLLIQSHQQLNDMEAVEKTLQEIEKDGKNCNWSTYSNLAAVYIRAGDSQKAEMALKKLEESSKTLRVRQPLPYHFLISFYAGIGNLEEVYRIWDSLKSDFKTISNNSYLVMLQGLLKLGQLDGLVKCFEEWKSGYKHYDLRLVSVMIAGYLRQNMIEEAEKVFNDAIEKSGTPFFRGCEMFIAHFLDKQEINLALGHLEAAIDAVKENDNWQLVPERIIAFHKYFAEQKDVDGAEKFCNLLRKAKCLESNSYLWLLRTYEAAGKTASEMRQKMKEDGIDIRSEHQSLLEKVCPE